MNNWVCCQLGAREHYAIPRSLHQSGYLSYLITDAWVKPQSIINRFPNSLLKSLQDRFHSDLSDARVRAFTESLIQFDLSQRFGKTAGWRRIMARNSWFQARVVQYLKRITPSFSQSNTYPVLFTYSYAALELLRYAKQQGWYTVLGQIDPGMIEEKIVLEEYKKHHTLEPNWQPAPPTYWQDWQQECHLVDSIVVNSAWSKHLLEQAGVAADKIKLVPLVYDPSKSVENFTRNYPANFTQQRPLRVLFLGLVTLRKGIATLLDAVRLLGGKPIEFWIVGPQLISIPPEFYNHTQIRWLGPVPRSQTQNYYQSADVFVFPTLSDGFGLTQLEAQAWKLPIIASQFCGEVVVNDVNGKILPEVTSSAIAEILESFLSHPQLLQHFSQHSIGKDQFNLLSLSQRLQALKE